MSYTFLFLLGLSSYGAWTYLDHSSQPKVLMEAKLLTIISAPNVQKFLSKNIVTRFNIPHTAITENNLHFMDEKLKIFMKRLGIDQRITSVEHPQTN